MSHLGSGEVDGGEQRQLQVASQSHESSLVPGYSQAPVWGWGACQSPRSCSLESPSTQPLVRAVPIVLFPLHWVGLGSGKRHPPYRGSPGLSFRHGVIRCHLGEGWVTFFCPSAFHHFPILRCHPENHNTASWGQRTFFEALTFGLTRFHSLAAITIACPHSNTHSTSRWGPFGRRWDTFEVPFRKNYRVGLRHP